LEKNLPFLPFLPFFFFCFLPFFFFLLTFSETASCFR